MEFLERLKLMESYSKINYREIKTVELCKKLRADFKFTLSTAHLVAQIILFAIRSK